MNLLSVICARRDEATERIEVVKEVEMPDGSVSLNLHTFSIETIEARAAEYGTDDVDEIIDMIIHEPFIQEVEYTTLSPAEALNLHRARRDVLKATIKTFKKLSADDEKASKLSRLRTAGVHQRYLDAVEDGNYVDVIKRHCVLRPEVVQLRKKLVEATRAAKAREKPAAGDSKATVARDLQRKIEQAKLAARAQRNTAAVKEQQPTHVKISLHKGKRR